MRCRRRSFGRLLTGPLGRVVVADRSVIGGDALVARSCGQLAAATSGGSKDGDWYPVALFLIRVTTLLLALKKASLAIRRSR